jgi:hypothetical protein
MDQKPKASNPPGKRTKPKESQKEQSERFIETARKLGFDESGREFDSIIKKIVPKRGKPS